ncbi:hypothetical protein BVRB_9g207220 [Beta vulgaris subsp. vulgaris]|nr:hypothetical protein BVRB_9g207220 [Beta vulgaris subsp. vulgaris]
MNSDQNNPTEVDNGRCHRSIEAIYTELENKLKSKLLELCENVYVGCGATPLLPSPVEEN